MYDAQLGRGGNSLGTHRGTLESRDEAEDGRPSGQNMVPGTYPTLRSQERQFAASRRKSRPLDPRLRQAGARGYICAYTVAAGGGGDGGGVVGGRLLDA